MADFISSLETVLVQFLPIILAITLHEAAHGYVAMQRGDMTAYQAGRVSFNPLKHIDLVGTLLIPGLLFLSHAPFLIGYAKPVPVNARYLRNPRWDMAWVALAGPAMNMVLFCLGALSLKFVGISGELGPWGDFAQKLSMGLIWTNVFIGLFNLLPILPLDGGRILNSCLPTSLSIKYARSEPYGMFIVLGLVLLLPWIFKVNPIGALLSGVGHFLVAHVFMLLGII